MVTRKPVPQAAQAELSLASEIPPPNPVTPITTDIPRNFQMQDVHSQMASSATDTEPNSANAWTGEGLDKHDTSKEPDLPESLRVGPPGYTPKTSQEKLRQNAPNTNPFLQRQKTGLSEGRESSADAWGGFAERPAQPSSAPPQPSHPPPPPPVHENTAFVQQLADLSISESSTNPWQPALDQREPTHPPPIFHIEREGSGNDAWSDAPAKQSSAATAASGSSQQPVLIDIPGPESPAWDEDDASPVLQELPANSAQEIQQMNEERHVWDDDGNRLNQAPSAPIATREDAVKQNEGWNLVDLEPTPMGQQSGVVASDGAILETYQEYEHAPALPPRRSQEHPPPQPPRPVLDASNTSSSLVVSRGTAAVRTQNKETYEIKKITWHDVNAVKNPRISPILVQNANGPCPLLALVNALTLSTPADVETALVDTLRSREQVSLGLLLDAVFDELMSGRRGDAAQELPDVSDLYSFLITLHTGMNVNPRFIPLVSYESPNDQQPSMSHVHPSERESNIPGTFEDTREMKLYSTFSIPLIHGWLPEPDSPAFAALSRSAKSYEDAQNIMFHEESLEDKLQNEGLSFEEQGTLEDISTIKAFFSSHATQLTPFGLKSITTSLTPGAVAILFRNDHFSTLYRHPDTLQLLQLVTDMGYAGHEEVVWESLLDVSGENAEFFSGDFRLVGGAPVSPSISNTNQASHPAGDGWLPVDGGHQNSTFSINTQSSHLAPESDADQPPQSPNTEQEDHDLALALQLQEEEEERHRNEIARRRRETELSQQFIEQQGASGNNGNIPVGQRGSSSRGTGNNNNFNNRNSSLRGGSGGAPELRPAIPPRRSSPNAGGQPIDPEAGVDIPPPSYEQAANQAAYVPPADHPSHPNSSPAAGRSRRTSSYSANSLTPQGGRPSGRRMTAQGPTLVEQISGNRRATNSGQGLSQQQQDERSKDCIVM